MGRTENRFEYNDKRNNTINQETKTIAYISNKHREDLEKQNKGTEKSADTFQKLVISVYGLPIGNTVQKIQKCID